MPDGTKIVLTSQASQLLSLAVSLQCGSIEIVEEIVVSFWDGIQPASLSYRITLQ